MKGKLLLITFISSILAIGVLGWNWMERSSEKITIKAYYMRYACGDDNIDMNVSTVDKDKYDFLISSDIFPKVNFLRQGDLIDFVHSKMIEYNLGKELYLQDFTLVGYLNYKISEETCANSVEFFVERIKYGNEQGFMEF